MCILAGRKQSLRPPNPSVVHQLSWNELRDLDPMVSADWIPRHREFLYGKFATFAEVYRFLLGKGLPADFGPDDVRSQVKSLIALKSDSSLAIKGKAQGVLRTHLELLLQRFKSGKDLLEVMVSLGDVLWNQQTGLISIKEDLDTDWDGWDPTMVPKKLSVSVSPIDSFYESSSTTTTSTTVQSSSKGIGGEFPPFEGTPDVVSLQKKIFLFVRENSGCKSQALRAACGPSSLSVAYKMPCLTQKPDGQDKRWSLV